MKPTDLKFGNYVMINRTFTPGKVFSITRHKVGYHLEKGEANLHYAYLHEVSPIEINENILKLFGFNITQENRYIFNDTQIKQIYVHDDENVCISISIQANGKLFLNGYTLGEHSKSIFGYLRYVHELQQFIEYLDYKCFPNMDDFKNSVADDLEAKRDSM